jgi:hypothetical protein
METTRASIDPLTNIIRPRGVRLRRDIKGLLIGPWAPAMVQPFVHELTHHWCFHSELGFVLASIHFRAIRRLFSDAFDGARLFDEMVTVDALLRLLHPLSEGLALFAEYDMLAGGSSVTTTPMLWTAVATTERSSFAQMDVATGLAFLNAQLLSIRTRPEALERKMGFLSKPVSRLDEAYFDGYLLVKRIYADLRARVPAFADSDLFLSYLRFFFFEDSGMTAVLTRFYDNPLDRVDALARRYEARLRQLYEGELAGDVALFGSAVSGPPGGEHDFDVPGLRISQEERAEAAKGRASLLQEFEDDPGLSPQDRAVLNIQRGWLSRRSVVFVATEPALVTVRNEMVQAWPDPRDEEVPLLVGGALPGTPDTPNPNEPVRGWISFLVHPTLSFYAPVVGIDDRLVAILRYPETDSAKRDLEAIINDPCCSPTVIEQERTDIDAWRDGYFREAPSELKSVIEQARQLVDRTLRESSDRSLEGWGSRPGAAARLRSGDRFWDLFAGNRKLFETFLALGLFHDRDVLEPRFLSLFSEAGIDVGSALLAARNLEVATGISLVRNDRGVFRWLV